MANDLGIRIKASLNEALSTNQINSDLARIAKNLNVDIGVNVKGLSQDIQREMANVQKSIKPAKINPVEIDVASIQKDTGAISRSIREYEKQFNATTTAVTKNVNQQTGEVQSLSVSMRNLKNEMMHMKLTPFEGQNGQLEYRLNEQNMRVVRQTAQEKERLLRYENSTRQAIERNKNAEQQKTRELQQQLDLYRRQAQVNVDNIRRTHGSVLTPETNRELDNYIKNVNALSTTTPNVRNQMKNLDMTFRELGTQVKSSSSHVAGFGEQMGVALKRIPVWMAGMTAFYAPLRGLRNATEQVIMLDTQMTELRRVMDATPVTYNNLLQDSIALSTELGNRVKDVNQAMVDFARQGYDPDTLIDLTGIATIASNISHLETTDAMSSLTAGMKAFNIEAEDSIEIIDRLNEVD